MPTNLFTAQTQYDDYTGTSSCEESELTQFLKNKGLIQENEKIVDFSFSRGDITDKLDFHLVCFAVENFVYEQFEHKLQNGEDLKLRKVETYISAQDLFSNLRRLEVQFSWKGFLTNSTHSYFE